MSLCPLQHMKLRQGVYVAVELFWKLSILLLMEARSNYAPSYANAKRGYCGLGYELAAYPLFKVSFCVSVTLCSENLICSAQHSWAVLGARLCTRASPTEQLLKEKPFPSCPPINILFSSVLHKDRQWRKPSKTPCLPSVQPWWLLAQPFIFPRTPSDQQNVEGPVGVPWAVPAQQGLV